jgi:hypothetical protein
VETRLSRSTATDYLMFMLRARHALWYSVSFVVLASYIYLAAVGRFYLFNGDHAIQIMMAKYFRWESPDFYYWGQNRLGSLVPLLLIVPIKVLALPALPSAVVCASAFYASTLLLLFANACGTAEKAAALFGFFLLPIGAYEFLLYTGHPYGPSMALTLAAFTLVFRPAPSHTQLFLAGCALSVSFWVSELTLAGIAPLCCLMFQRRRSLRLNAVGLAAFLIGIALLAPFILHWRHSIGLEGHDAEYLQFASLEMLTQGVRKFLPQFSDMTNSRLAFKPPIVWAVAAILVLVNPLILLARRWVGEGANRVAPPILTFLAMHNCAYFLIVLLSRHAYFGEGLIQRFWVPVILYSIYALFVLTARMLRRPDVRSQQAVFTLATCVVVVGLSKVNIASWPGQSDDQAFRAIQGHWDDLREVRMHRANRVTADYWRALPLNVLSEFEILAVPRDFSRTAQFRERFSEEARRRNPDAFLDLP